ncbi:hypothetical protein EGX47_16555 [Yersinia pseudotuberculosis]|uniref:Uncharacterized protein n=1 Tax=Yersinia pseudotuberculosis TaxID=633 RepID=A0ABM7AJC7_YERPU|nr:hypothetical protein EGX47_16555 [Yersinia pseudotuberculosis]AYW96973.1 hypothetical protein EGX39_14895 [Yersinia pseudotuberculosis]MBP0068489.1 hypothetical protein [Yersinia pseudotuberculosis]
MKGKVTNMSDGKGKLACFKQKRLRSDSPAKWYCGAQNAVNSIIDSK